MILFFENFTQIDAAVIDYRSIRDGGPLFVGHSWMVDATVSGPVEKKEGVVYDFGAFKKLMKEYCDGTGPDHKAIITLPSAESDRKFSEHTSTSPGRTHTRVNYGNREHDITLTVPICREGNPGAAFKVRLDFEAMAVEHALEVRMCADFAQFLEEKLPGHQDVKVSFELRKRPTAHNEVEFTYCHGLPASTSYGCQNILHGHRSFLRLPEIGDTDSKLKSHLLQLLQKLAGRIDGKYLVNSAHLIGYDGPDNDEDNMCVSYTSLSRGKFQLNLPSSDVVVLNNHTTVEHLSAYLSDLIAKEPEFSALRGHTIFVSEGVSKGAVIRV